MRWIELNCLMHFGSTFSRLFSHRHYCYCYSIHYTTIAQFLWYYLFESQIKQAHNRIWCMPNRRLVQPFVLLSELHPPIGPKTWSQMCKISAVRLLDSPNRSDRCRTFPKIWIAAVRCQNDIHFCVGRGEKNFRHFIHHRFSLRFAFSPCGDENYWNDWNVTYVHLQGISPRKLVFFVSRQTRPSAATHQTFATFSFVQPYGCCVFGSMKSASGSGHKYCPTRNWLQSTSAESTNTISYKSDSSMRVIIIFAELYLIVNAQISFGFGTNNTHLQCASMNIFIFNSRAEISKFLDTFPPMLSRTHTMDCFSYGFEAELWNVVFVLRCIYVCITPMYMMDVCVCMRVL